MNSTALWESWTLPALPDTEADLMFIDTGIFQLQTPREAQGGSRPRVGCGEVNTKGKSNLPTVL
jgi:hypothetical protein